MWLKTVDATRWKGYQHCKKKKIEKKIGDMSLDEMKMMENMSQ